MHLETLLSDYVFNLAETIKAGLELLEACPRIPVKQSTLGLKMVPNLPEIMTEEGVRVFTADPVSAWKLVDIVKRYPRL
ncbi:hypothetical protein C7999DRAFT_34040 [Corynascus novoguineensis]|uniref:Uncharacterized protein n=1 Tax=Corynascus novoguineensis TaxID=1126955 RepID=A0AAN7HHD4_9PEZI|nr:hypothetical protein C7999DRAFT_34040 [Corynascus novoguineensis]